MERCVYARNLCLCVSVGCWYNRDRILYKIQILRALPPPQPPKSSVGLDVKEHATCECEPYNDGCMDGIHGKQVPAALIARASESPLYLVYNRNRAPDHRPTVGGEHDREREVGSQGEARGEPHLSSSVPMQSRCRWGRGRYARERAKPTPAARSQ